MHGGKGTSLSIENGSQIMDVYMFLYKPQIGWVSPGNDEGKRSQQPLLQNYYFAPSYPLTLVSIAEQIYHGWTETDDLSRFQVKGLFYQWVYEQFRQWSQSNEMPVQPELAEQIARYIQEHYAEPISMETLASMFHYSSRYLARVFKRKYGCSPMDYVIQKRMNRARILLMETDVQIKDVADSVGYKDLYYFSRIFKKTTGETPTQFKMHSYLIQGSNRTNNRSQSYIADTSRQRYIVNNDNHYQYNTWSVNDLNVRFKPSLAVSFLFSLALLLAACGASETQTQTVNDETPQETTRMYIDALGREVNIPIQPTKPVVITYGGYLLPLGIAPTGVDKQTLDQYPEEMKDVTDIGSGTGNTEVIVGLEPDIIIVPDYTSSDVIGTYERIAPTVAVAWGGDPDVINTLRTMGDIMDRKDQAEQWISTFETKLDGIRSKLSMSIAPGTTAMSFVLYNGEVLLGGEGGTLGKLIYEDFGFDMPEEYKAFADGGTVLSLEKLAAEPADYFITQMTDEEMGQMMDLFKEPVYQSIPAVKNKRIINVSRDFWNYGPYTVDKGVDVLMEQVSHLQK
ncbi:AraC family transcriptional regulator [Paenibacillus sp. MER 99-2]|uniref:AraC family transcriptional regulator n=1 Tax=Paenibacillus sp. MER 99-2 TaxID=2939572 RepID=UPI00203F6AA8|nr:AraC family transcriptional regulator [Paenibacillus sp. MER 99-2]MCM3170870.1 AraC family transcriptional regulator [Paenibacillus sp. MER 99-2]